MHDHRLQIAPCPPEAVERLRRELRVSRALAQVLVRRGLADPVAAAAFLAGDEHHPPEAFAGIELAVEPIVRHLRAGSQITVHGDYDVDGMCSTAVLLRALRALGACADSYLPDRASDGYGLGEDTVRRLAARGTRLLVTADCGISSAREVALARELGLEVVITDHHAPPADGELPDAPIVHPALCGYPCAELCATAVAHKLARAVHAGAREQGGFAAEALEAAIAGLREDLDLVALATVADVVPLLGENRALVKLGLRALSRTGKPGLRALMQVARVDASRVRERELAFALAPRLNAAGRLYRADAGLELLMTRDARRAGEIARELDAANHERRDVELAIRIDAEAQIARLGERSAYVLAGERWHAGVVGIVASRLAEQTGRPVVLVALDGERARGSGRSVEAFDLLAGLTACGAHLVRYGGHRAAAGVELERSSLDAFADAFAAHAERVLEPEALVPVERVDAVVGGDELGMDLAEELRSLAPFGHCNPPVNLLVEDATFTDIKPMGEGRHARFTVLSRGARARAVAFGSGAQLGVAEGEPAAATFALEVNEWNGVSEPRLVLRRAGPAERALLAAERAQAAPEAAAGREAAGVAGEPTEAAPEAAGAAAQAELVLFSLP